MIELHKPDGTVVRFNDDDSVEIDTESRRIIRCLCGSWRLKGKDCLVCFIDDGRG